MRRRNHRTETDKTLKKTDPQIGFKFTDPLSSRANSELKRRRRVTFKDVDPRSPLNEAQAGSSIDAKTSEFAFFKKLKSNFGHCSESSDSYKSSNEVNRNPEILDSRVKLGEYAGTDREANDRSKICNFSTPIHRSRRGLCVSAMLPINLTQRDKEKDSWKSSLSFSRDRDAVRSGNHLRSGSGEISDEKGDIFFLKRQKLHQWVKCTWFPESPELTSNGHDVVSVLLTRLFPGAEETHPSRFSKEKMDRVKRRMLVESPGSKVLKKYTEIDHSLQMERDRLISWHGWLENNFTPRLQYPTGHAQSTCIPRDPEEISFPILCSKESVYRPPLLKQKACLSFSAEENLDCSPISSLHFRNYKPISLKYHSKDSGYSSEDLSHEHREPSSALLLEWNTETESTRKTDDFPHSYDTKLITYPNASSSILTDNPWRSDSSSSHDLVTRDIHPLPLLPRYTSSSFFLPTRNQTSHFEHELERHIDEDAVAANQRIQTYNHTNRSDCLARDYTYYRNLSNSQVDQCPFKVPGCEIVSFPFSSISNSNLLEVSSPTQSDCFKSHDWISFQFQSPQDS